MESKSTFVTVLAWIFIITSGLLLLISVMQAVMMSTSFSGDAFQTVPDNAPVMQQFMMQHFHLFIYGFSALTLFTFISSVALLKRKSWARLAFISILVIGIAWQVGGLIMQFVMFDDFPTIHGGERDEHVDRMMNIARWFSAVMSLMITGVFAWIIKRLCSRPVSREFTRNHSNPV